MENLVKLKEIKYYPSLLKTYQPAISMTRDYDEQYDWDQLKKDLIDYGYNTEKIPSIRVSKDNIILDGHHRIVILNELFGSEHEIIINNIGLKHYAAFIIIILLSPFFVVKIYINFFKRIIKQINKI